MRSIVLALLTLLSSQPSHATALPGEAIQLDQNGNQSITHVDLQTGRHIVFYQHPQCGWCSKALQEMPPDMRAALQSQGILVMKYRSSRDIALAQQFNQEHNGMKTLLVQDPSVWAGIDFSKGTPSWFFVNQGKVTCSVTGWGGNAIELFRKCLNTY